jgi:tRNA1(Val) A37 N6-methylase TrmN6
MRSDRGSAGEHIDETGFLAGKVMLRQLRRGHRAGTDAALLVAAARPYAKGRVADLGAGVGAIGLSLAMLDRTLELLLIEIDPLLARLADEAASANGCAARVEVLNLDLRAIADGRSPLPSAGSCDLAVMNPPFADARGQQASPDPLRARAHVMPRGGLAAWIDAARALLKPKGALVVIHRPDALDELLAALRSGFGAIALRPVHPRADQPATRILLFARKGSRAPLSIAPALVLHEGNAFTPLAAMIHRGEAGLAFR